MNKSERGIIKALILLVVGFSVLFLVFAIAARYVAPIAATPTPGRITERPGTNYVEKANPMLDIRIEGGSGSYGGYGDRDLDKVIGENRSKHAGKVRLSYGNASYAIQPYEEYLTLKNEGSAVNITGWKLENGKGTRPIEYSQNSYVYPSPESAYIGQGTEFLDPSGKYIIGPVILGTGDSAIVTTGAPFSNFPLPITTNFRENMCVGYLANYPFNPQLEQRCPYPVNDPAIRTVTDQCYDYLRSLQRCQDPTKTDTEDFEELTSHCRAFIRERLNYPSCVVNNRYSSGFASKQWRIFLGKSHEMWASRREVITLYDATGLIVDQISY